MEVILREDVEKLGARGQLVKVASGYARNFLLPKRLAVPATEANKKIIEQERQAHLRREAKEVADASDLAKMMTDISVTISQKAGENDQLFGSVTSKDIVEALEKQGYTIDRRKIALEEPIKSLGDFKVPVRLHREVTTEISVHVIKETE
ncbi:MAG TPA: 50S ribosomal protein L9 [Bryobacteraceae bacterium]|nr:50S ribosomal protein L9 [Bryobacteraceae bacterium]